MVYNVCAAVALQNLGYSKASAFFLMHSFALSTGSLCQKYRGEEPPSPHLVKGLERAAAISSWTGGHKAKAG